MMALCMFVSELGDAHAILVAPDITSAEHGAELAGAHALFEAVEMTSEEHDVAVADAPAPLEFSSGHAVELAAALTRIAPSAGMGACKAAVAVESKSGG